MSTGQVEKAKRRALIIFDNWQRITGVFRGSSYEWEVRAIIEDAVEIGIQEALDIYKPLDAEKDIPARRMLPKGEVSETNDWETPCLKREDGIHCTCWYDGEKCCACGDPALPEDDRQKRGPHPKWGTGH